MSNTNPAKVVRNLFYLIMVPILGKKMANMRQADTSTALTPSTCKMLKHKTKQCRLSLIYMYMYM